ncbi:MAG TPA: hypothetical protein VN872_09405 [Candidatus Acidoferrum sp.]|nr:hypothetical protein [Candidatus Acidoferrum sp.]
MKKILYLLVLFSLVPGGYAQDPASICCRGLAPATPGTIQLPMVSKVPLDVQQECPPGTAMRAISFSHQNDQNLTFQESFALTCASSPSVVTNQCQWGQLISNFALSTTATAPGDSVITGVRFTHRFGQDFTYQQSYAVRTCRLQHPRSRAFPRGKPAGGTTKWHLQSHASCSLSNGGVTSGLVDRLGFNHGNGYNGTHEEGVSLGCVYD